MKKFIVKILNKSLFLNKNLVYSQRYPRYTAFSLAEVLITLGVIGVVAAMTIPTLIQSSDKQVTITGYKKAYATLTNAVKMSEADNGEIDNWDWSFTPYDNAGTNLTWMNTYLLPYLKNAKACNGTTNTGCFTKYVKAPGGYNLSFNPETDGHFLKYTLADGTQLAAIFRDTSSIEILVDLNGLKGPNMMGKDIFDFMLVNKTSFMGVWALKIGGVYPYGYGAGVDPINNTTGGCSKGVTHPDSAGLFCGLKIIQDGYQIKSDYPW